MAGQIPPAYRALLPSISDRTFWTSKAAEARLKPLWDWVDETAAGANEPARLLATDWLAATRTNDRKCADNHWQNDRKVLSALILRRAKRGVDPNDPDDRLLNWIWSFATEPAWTVSAHVPDSELPGLDRAHLDLAACEFAGFLAEACVVLRPWMESVSKHLFESIIAEIDRKVLTPFAKEPEKYWWFQDLNRTNNWAGVCGGGILAATAALAEFNMPRNEARQFAVEALRRFLTYGFTPGGECDEGISYWAYGIGYACNAYSRMTEAELSRDVDMRRLAQIAAYPSRVDLGDDWFFSGNDAGLRGNPQMYFVPWLACATRDEFLWNWACSRLADRRNWTAAARDFSSASRMLVLPETPAVSLPDPPEAGRYLEDQHVLIAAQRVNGRRMVACLTGGNNAERHNHNDLGHFIVLLDEELIIPDLGAPFYTTDFFGPKRYTYLAPSSRGHCCPIINGCEQREGRQAAAVVLEKDLDRPKLRLDLTSAYPPEANLKQWQRELSMVNDGYVITDEFDLAAGSKLTHVVWSTVEPKVVDEHVITLGALALHVDGHASRTVEPVDPKKHLLRDFKETLYRIAYEIDASTGRARVATRITL